MLDRVDFRLRTRGAIWLTPVSRQAHLEMMFTEWLAELAAHDFSGRYRVSPKLAMTGSMPR